MAKQYYDQPITASTKWGGDSSTGGKQVKGSRVQEWIKGQFVSILEALATASGNINTNAAAITTLTTLIGKRTPAVFGGFVEDVEAENSTYDTCDSVVFDTAKGYFLGVITLTRKYYKTFPGKENYNNGTYPNFAPYTDKVYIYGADTYVWDGEKLTCTTDSLREALTTALTGGTIIPALAGDIESWEERSAEVESVFTDAVRTTAGDESIDSDKPARLVSIVAKSDFSASALKATGFNLLHGAEAVGGGYYFAVPKLTFGAYGTADENNGVLFTKNDGTNLTPTVRFKPIADGVPVNVNDGSVCSYTDSNGKRFYTTSGAGYLIVSGITLANTCAHIAWSRRYDEFISPTAEGDAGSTISLTAIIAACHDYGLLLVATNAYGTVADGITFGSSQATWTKRVERVKPTWTTVDNGDGTYTHTATISGMKEGGIAECGQLQLEVTLNVVSYTDSNSAATTDYVKYELATEATGTVNVSPTYNVEDWGLELLVGISGEAEVTVEYAQGFPDAVAALLTIRKLFEAKISNNEGRINDVESMTAELDGRTNGLPVLAGQPMKLYGAGTPAEELVPDNWIGFNDGGYVWTGLPTAIGQEYIDTLNGGKYEAVWDNYDNRTLKWLAV